MAIQTVRWTTSPPLAPEGPALDIPHLERMTLGERELEREVLLLFAQQAGDLLRRLEKLPREGWSLAHTLKGSAGGIGAFAVAEAAGEVERSLRHGLPAADAMMALRLAVHGALIAINERLGGSGGE
jgi:HPt (histidine-containing phosphotransfer) domain-containing protein